MKTGNHNQLEDFIQFGNIKNQCFDLTGEWYTLKNYDLKNYHRKFALIDHRLENRRLWNNKEYWKDLNYRIEYLAQENFTFIIANPWESKSNIAELEQIELKNKSYVYWTGQDSWFWWMMHQRYKNKIFDINHNEKKYDFFYLNKNPRKHRIKLFDKMYNNNLLDRSLYSFLDKKIKLDAEYELPWVDANNYPKYGFDRDIFEKPYNHSVINLISETHDFGEVFITEKTWKAIIMKQLFVVHGKKDYLSDLKKLGFKTFDNIFNESYDSIDDPDLRINAIVDLCKQLKTKDWKVLYERTESIREHNYKMFFDSHNLKNCVSNTLGGFLKFADSR